MGLRVGVASCLSDGVAAKGEPSENLPRSLGVGSVSGLGLGVGVGLGLGPGLGLA